MPENKNNVKVTNDTIKSEKPENAKKVEKTENNVKTTRPKVCVF